ncbi:PHB depolymerase family esterase [Actibacterium sp. 188UL27-1]|uniref:alpha/beta hydrolase family esterase n=1 Tax=Actibacterium sp. 188UL27-1 TaxID=2786961 RepID=UPI00195EFADC|nr:polyhydroxybutyrate depolymerase [Actibacterium sp. 188UL27-1]MBM7069351.1 polyhydroxybutyrate depolymerase [Actibacterium sp. 188UL27-1]
MRLTLAFLLTLMATMAVACVEQEPCYIGDRSYHVKEPDGWDGITPLPVMLHFHGWGRQGTLTVKHSRIAGATVPRGVLLLGPNGRGRTWDFWRAGSNDTTFAEAVLEDAAKRYPIDRSRIYISGYSFGSAMAWRFACDSDTPIAALLAVAGTLDQRESCVNTPGEVRHVHGLKDTVMDFPYGPGGDTTHPVALWRRAFGCGAGTDLGQWTAPKGKDLFSRIQWTCDSGQVTLDLHPRGHFIPVGWIAQQLDEIMATAPESG